MTMPEWMLIADVEYRRTPEGRADLKREGWLKDADLTDQEWNDKYGPASN